MAVCELPNGTSDGSDASSLGSQGFELLIGLNEIHKPRMWVEKLPLQPNEQATMLTFYPEFQTKSGRYSASNQQVLILLDLSNSMKHDDAYYSAIQVACLTLWKIPEHFLFNVIVFGTDFEELFYKSVPNSAKNRTKAIEYLTEKSNTFEPMGGTDANRPISIAWELFNSNMKDFARKQKLKSFKTTFLLISDGHISQPTQSSISSLFDQNKSLNFRLFANGVSSSCDKHTLRVLCDKGAGYFEFFDTATKSSWMKKVKCQVEKFSQHVLTNVSIKWVLHEDKDDAHLFDLSNPDRVIQAPANLTALFDGQRVVVYGIVPFCQQAILEAELNGHKVSTVVSTSDHMATEGHLVHQLAARAVIRDWETSAVLHSDKATHEFAKAELKNTIIRLSLKHQVVTPFTSFIAVEKRDKVLI